MRERGIINHHEEDEVKRKNITKYVKNRFALKFLTYKFFMFQ